MFEMLLRSGKLHSKRFLALVQAKNMVDWTPRLHSQLFDLEKEKNLEIDRTQCHFQKIKHVEQENQMKVTYYHVVQICHFKAKSGWVIDLMKVIRQNSSKQVIHYFYYYGLCVVHRNGFGFCMSISVVNISARFIVNLVFSLCNLFYAHS